MRVVCWNVGGLRAAARKGLRAKLRRMEPDIFGIQEVRARPEQLAPSLRNPRGWVAHYVVADRPGYSGVGLWSRRPPDEVQGSLGQACFDVEGRVQLARFGRLTVANVYFPCGNGKDRSNDRVPYKLSFYAALFDELQRRRRSGQRVLVMGDFNTVPAAIDLARPKDNRKTSGFLPEEVAELQRWLGHGWVDTFRAFEPGPGHYTWWSTRGDVRSRNSSSAGPPGRRRCATPGKARLRNIGWRIDLVLASPAAMRFVRRAFILPRVMGSDHCPLGVDLDPAIVGRRRECD